MQWPIDGLARAKGPSKTRQQHSKLAMTELNAPKSNLDI